VNPAEILAHLRTFTAREKIALPPASVAVPEIDAYEPFGKYLLELAKDSKPERVAEDLFVAVARDIARLKSIPQVNVGDGFVDFLVGGEEQGAGGVVIELKPLFTKYNLFELRRTPLKPANHKPQVKKYLRKHEYVVLTDLRTACLYSARDFFITDSFFAELPFADLLERTGDQLDLLDVLRQAEDAQEKPDLDRQFFEDLKEWFAAFQNVHWKKPEDSAELIILLLNKLIFAKTLEDHGLVPYRFLQDEYDQQEDRWETKGPHRVVQAFLEALEPFFDEYYDTELFERRIWDEIDRSHDNLSRFCTALKLVLGISKWDRVLAQRGIVNYNYRTINEDIFGKSYEMFLAANRKDEGIYYTPATITVPMAESLVASLFGPLVDEICAAVGKDTCDFAKARALMERLTRLHIADTASGSGGFLIKILRSIWAQYQRIAEALAWLNKLNVSGDLFDLPANVRDVAQFRDDFHLSDKRQLLLHRAVHHLAGQINGPRWMRLVVKTNLMREVIKTIPHEFHFRRFPNSLRGFSELEEWSVSRINTLCVEPAFS
jgi:mRNA-degrading endonuclease HigB of HigAB toxin-antitoxin module